MMPAMKSLNGWKTFSADERKGTFESSTAPFLFTGNP